MESLNRKKRAETKEFKASQSPVWNLPSNPSSKQQTKTLPLTVSQPPITCQLPFCKRKSILKLLKVLFLIKNNSYLLTRENLIPRMLVNQRLPCHINSRGLHQSKLSNQYLQWGQQSRSKEIDFLSKQWKVVQM